MKSLSRRDICPPMLIEALFKKVNTWKQPKCLSTDEWIKVREWHGHIYTTKCKIDS